MERSNQLILEERESFVWFTAVPQIGSQTVKRILAQVEKREFGFAEIANTNARSNLIHSKSELFLKEAGLSDKQLDSVRSFRHQYSPQGYSAELAEKNIQITCWDEEQYPLLLREVSTFPPVLYFMGSAEAWRVMPVAVVGTRHMTEYGVQATRAITRQLADLGAAIVSGFMYGVDMESHLTALKVKAKTVGVLGYGFDYLYKQSIEYPIERLLEQGNAFVTEFPPFIPGLKANFPIRNRIVAGMSLATVVIEAAQKSGSLNTASHAADFGRNVYAVAGPFTSVYSEGTKKLINDGAKLISSGFEVIEDLLPSVGSQLLLDKTDSENQDEVEDIDQLILETTQNESMSTDELAMRLKVPLSTLLPRLSYLEVLGKLTQDDDKWQSQG